MAHLGRLLTCGMVCYNAGMARKGYRQSERHIKKRISARLETLRNKPKPVSEEWLRNQYWLQEKSCVDIANEVGRDPKTVWAWMKFYGIETRPRGHNPGPHFKTGHQIWVGRKHKKSSRKKMSDARKRIGGVPYLKNGKHWMHNEDYDPSQHPHWQGGSSPERQEIYGSPEWKRLVAQIYARDKRTCQKCGKVKRRDDPFDIHHIAPFRCKKLRMVLSNLILLCEPCHYWIHSKYNTKGELIAPCK